MFLRSLKLDYYPFGMTMPGRNWISSVGGYRYSHNGHEKENEIFEGAQSAEYWMYDSRLGRRWELDPLAYEYQSPYAAFNNNPIYFSDPRGLKGDGDGNKGKKGGDLKNGSQPQVVQPSGWDKVAKLSPEQREAFFAELQMEPKQITSVSTANGPGAGNELRTVPVKPVETIYLPSTKPVNNESLITPDFMMSCLNFKANFNNNPNPLINLKIQSEYNWKEKSDFFKGEGGIYNFKVDINSSGISTESRVFKFAGAGKRGNFSGGGKMYVLDDGNVYGESTLDYGIYSYNISKNKVGVGPTVKGLIKVQVEADVNVFSNILSDCYTGLKEFLKTAGDKMQHPQNYSIPNGK